MATPPVVSGQSITSFLPAAFFNASSGVNLVEGSVLQLFCTADSTSAVITWGCGGTVLTNDPPHIRIRSNSDASTVTSILTVDDFQTANNGAYQCRVGQTAMATTQTLTAFTPMNLDDTLFMFRNPSTRETIRDPGLQPDNRSAVALGDTIDPYGTSNANLLLRCVAAHIDDAGQPLGTLVWTINGQMLTNGSRVTVIPLVFINTRYGSLRYGADLRITNFITYDAGIYQCIATDNSSSDSDVVTSLPFRLDTDLVGDVLRLERVFPEVIPLIPPNKLVIEVKASGRYGNINWTKDGSPLVVDSPNELPNFAEIFVRGVTTTRQPESLVFQVVLPPTFTLNGAVYTNNSVVLLTGIGVGDHALLCRTDNTQCCGSSDTSGDPIGEWYFPNGSQIQDGQDPSRDIFRNRGTSIVRLNRRSNAVSPTGLYRCEIPDASGATQSLFIGVFTSSYQGAPSIQSVLFELTSAISAATPSFNLHCVTTGGPVDFNDITWTRDGSSLPANHELMFQGLDDGSTATYSNTLAVTGIETGQYACQLEHSGNTTSVDITVEAAGEPVDLIVSRAIDNLTSILVSWSASTTGLTVTGYVIYYETSGTEESVNIGAGSTETTLTGLTIGNSYSISIIALSEQLPSMLVAAPFAVTLAPVPPPPAIIALVPQSPTAITLSWQQPAGDVVNRYDIVYIYQGGCSDYTQPENMATVNGGTAREYTLQNLEEFSAYSISIAAVNSIGPSTPAIGQKITFIDAPSGPPQSVVMMSVTSSRITIQWGRVSCIDRNSEITGYTVQYGQTGNTHTIMESVPGTSDSDRMFTARGLTPGTSYTFEVAAVSSNGTGPFSTVLAVETSPPDTVLFQVRFVGQLDCGAWIVTDNQEKREEIAGLIVRGVVELCSCGFTRHNITDDAFQCFSADAVTYRGMLHGIEQATSVELAGVIGQWTEQEEAIPVQGIIFNVDSTCTVLIDSLGDSECAQRPSSSSGTSAIVAGVIAGVAVVGIAIVLTPIIAYLYVKKKTKTKNGAAELKRISTAPCAAYELTAVQGPVYEEIDEHSLEAEYKHTQPPQQPDRRRGRAMH